MPRVLRLLGILLYAGSLLAQEPAPAKRVLALFPLAPSRPGALALVQGLMNALNQEAPAMVEVQVEHVSGDLSDLPWLLGKYRAAPPLVIVSLQFVPMPVAAALRDQLGGAIPLVSLLHAPSVAAVHPAGPGVVRMNVRLDTLRSVATALQVFPDTLNLAVLGGSSPNDRAINEVSIEGIRRRWPHLSIIDLRGLTLAEVRRRVAVLPARTLCWAASFEVDAGGRIVTRPSLIDDLAPVTKVPLFDLTDLPFGRGVVGGWMSSYEPIGAEVGRVIARLLHGEAADSFPLLEFAGARYRFDARQLERWRIPESRLPPGSRVEFRAPSLWEAYRPWWIALLSAGATLVAVVLYLLVERWRRARLHADYKEKVGLDALFGQVVEAMGSVTVTNPAASVPEILVGLRRHVDADFAGLVIFRDVGTRVISQRFSSPEDSPWTGLEDLPWVQAEIEGGRSVQVRSLAELPATASVDCERLRRAGVSSLFATRCQTGRLAAILYGGSRAPRSWAGGLVQRIRELGESTLALWEQKISISQAVTDRIVSSFEGYVAVLDRAGHVLHSNRPAPGPGLAPVGPIEPYEAIWSQWPQESALWAGKLGRVLAGEVPEAEEEIHYDSGDGERWLHVSARRRQPAGGAVVMHLDSTLRKKAELSRVSDLAQISHDNRISALGLLATSLAHELNQPLMAILANTDVARSLLGRKDVDPQEIESVLADVQEDGRRAADVLADARNLLRKNPVPSPPVLDVAEVVRDTARLMAAHMLNCHVRIELHEVSDTGEVAIGRTRLQQVLLNLLQNALDAVAATPEAHRLVRLRTSRTAGRMTIDVEDAGPGIPPERRSAVFEPFVTSKANGLGVGLAISKSIVHTAGGRISVEESELGGARFRVELPLVA